MLTGIYLLLLIKLKKAFKSLNWGILGMIWIATTFGFLDKKYALLSGIIGVELNTFLSVYLGKTGPYDCAYFRIFDLCNYSIQNHTRKN